MEISGKINVAKIFLLLLLACPSYAQQKKYQLTQAKMGSPFTITVYHHDSVYAFQKMIAGFQLVDSLNALYSDYDSTALAYQLSAAPAGQWISVPSSMMQMLVHCKKVNRISEGSFDITIGILSRYWRKQRRAGVFPAPDSIENILKHTGWKNLELDESGLRIRKKDAWMRFDFGGIAKGYAAQMAIDFLQQNGILIALADAGGDIACGAPPPGKYGWNIAVNLPEEEAETWGQMLQLKHSAVATSGDMYQVMEHAGKFYSHIIDPRTGYGVTYRRNVTVVAPDGATADWLATACSILPIRKAKTLARKQHAEFLIAQLVDEKIITSRTKNFPALQQL